MEQQPARRQRYPLFLTLLILVFLTGISIRCSDQCEVTNTYVYYEPVYSTSAEIKAAVAWQEPQTLRELGKIYFKDNVLFINEIGQGIHVIDNRDPKNPTQLGFLNIPGNYDLAILGNSLYADSFVDLVVFDVSDLSTIKEIRRIENLFNHHQSLGFGADPQKGIITSWKKVENITVLNDCNSQPQPWGGIFYRGGVAFDVAQTFSSKAALAPGGSNSGIGGSMARFTLAANHLYALDGGYLDVVDVSAERNPISVNEVSVRWDVETVFPYKGSLFIGSRTGMYIYDLKDPKLPVLLSRFQHLQSCDPVVVEGDYAYVTLRSGNLCGNAQSQLQVVNISNLVNPYLVSSYPLVNPYGLGIDNGTLFICDGTDGLKIYDARNPNRISDNLLAHYKQINTLDVIPHQNIAMMIGSDGLFQYDYSDLKNIKLLSKLTIAKP